MAGIYDWPDTHPADRVLAVSKALGFLALASELLDENLNRTAITPGDCEGLAILLRECVRTLDEVAVATQEATDSYSSDEVAVATQKP